MNGVAPGAERLAPESQPCGSCPRATGGWCWIPANCTRPNCCIGAALFRGVWSGLRCAASPPEFKGAGRADPRNARRTGLAASPGAAAQSLVGGRVKSRAYGNLAGWNYGPGACSVGARLLCPDSARQARCRRRRRTAAEVEDFRIRRRLSPGAPGSAVHPLLPVRAVPHSLRLDAADPGNRRFHFRQQVRVRASFARHQYDPRRSGETEARGRGGVQTALRPAGQLHQAHGRAAGGCHRVPGQAASNQRRARRGERAGSAEPGVTVLGAQGRGGSGRGQP